MYLYQIMHANHTDLSCLLVCLSSAVWCKVSRPDTSTPSTPPWQGPGPHPVTAYIQHMTFKVLMLLKVIFSQPAISIVGRQVGAY